MKKMFISIIKKGKKQYLRQASWAAFLWI